MKIIVGFFLIAASIMAALNIVRLIDQIRMARAWKEIADKTPATTTQFSPDLIQDLPEPAQRFFTYAISPGTPIGRAIEIDMTGQLGLGPKDDPGYSDMRATQIMAPPYGFIWQVKTGQSPLTMSGSDGFTADKSWTRFWLMGTVPVARVKGHKNKAPDHRRSAFGRLVAESAMWAPDALLPSEYAQWVPLGPDSARVTVTYNGLSQELDIFVNAQGQLKKVIIPRWSDSNPGNVYQTQPFGGYVSEFRTFGGFRLPTHVEGGNHIGTEAYFPFFIADVSDIRFLAHHSKDAQ